MARPRRLVGGVAPAFLAVASALQPALRARTPALASCRSRPAVARADAVTALRAGGGGGDDTTAAARGYDCAVIGAGPAGSVVAWLLAEREGLRVALVDANLDKPWPNNYGVWEAEWHALSESLPELELRGCVDATWPRTDCFFGGSWGAPPDERTTLQRAYCRVDRATLKERLRRRAADAGVVEVRENLEIGPGGDWCANVVDGVAHDAAGTTLHLQSGSSLRCTVVVDCTGAESRLTTRRGPDVGAPIPPPGFQVAYGVECLVRDLGPYADDAMLLFDYRTDHLPAAEQRAPPTFLYAMPLGTDGGGPRRVFFEETSLVARPAVTLAECERRLKLRLAHLGIDVVEVCADEPPELCYIPMGGPRPDPRQRVVAFGAAAALVHPATGYQLCRALAAAPHLSGALGRALRQSPDPDRAARAAYAAVWSRQASLQREFALFGGEFLMTLDAEALRGWFAGFFALDEEVWGGFLAGWRGLPGNHHHESRAARLLFGLSLVPKLPPPVTLKLASFILEYSLKHGGALMRSLTPFFGDGAYFSEDAAPPGSPRQVGDAAVKAEIRARVGG